MKVLVTLVGLTLAAFGYKGLELALKRLNWLPPRYTSARLRVGLGLQWVVAAVLIAFVLMIEDRSLASIGLQITKGDLFYGVILGVIIGVLAENVSVVLLQYFGITSEPDEVTVFMLAQPPQWKAIIALTAGITEEIMFRGYLIERTLDLTNSKLLAGTLSVVVFMLIHLQGRRARSTFPTIFGSGVGLVITYLIFRNVIIVAIVHIVLDVVVFVTYRPEDALKKMDVSTLDDRIVSLIDDE